MGDRERECAAEEHQQHGRHIMEQLLQPCRIQGLSCSSSLQSFFGLVDLTGDSTAQKEIIIVIMHDIRI